MIETSNGTVKLEIGTIGANSFVQIFPLNKVRKLETSGIVNTMPPVILIFLISTISPSLILDMFRNTINGEFLGSRIPEYTGKSVDSSFTASNIGDGVGVCDAELDGVGDGVTDVHSLRQR